jgi:hypothetical protein
MGSVIGVVIARRGSTRLPGKNKRLFCGHSLVWWSVIQLRCSRLVDRTILATDSEEMADMARDEGAEVFWREGVKDDDPGGLPFIQVLDWLDSRGETPEIYATLLPTSPMRQPDDIDRCIRALQRGAAKTVYLAAWPKETLLAHALTDDDGIYCLAADCIFDKAWKYIIPCGGMGVTTSEHYRRLWMLYTKSDGSLYTCAEGRGSLPSWNGASGFVEVPLWQSWETDTSEQFDDCEIMFTHKFLRRYGDAGVYRAYKVGTWEPPPRTGNPEAHGVKVPRVEGVW